MTGGSAPGISTGAIAFSDIVGFTEMTADHGDDLAMALVDQHETLALGVLGQHGRIVKQLGDGLLLFFPDPCEAVDAMLRVHDGASRLSVDGVPFRLRTGLHFGSPRARGGDLIGHDVNLASRISTLAGPGELLASEALLHEIGDRRSQFTRIGPVFVKVVRDPVRLWRADSVQARAAGSSVMSVGER